jgi:hypothetical protein
VNHRINRLIGSGLKIAVTLVTTDDSRLVSLIILPSFRQKVNRVFCGDYPHVVLITTRSALMLVVTAPVGGGNNDVGYQQAIDRLFFL